MTYVTEQTSQELRAHMRRLKAMAGWHDPLADRLYKEILELDARLEAKAVQAEPPKWEVKEAESNWREISQFDFGFYQSLCQKCPDRYQMRIIKPPIGAQE